MKKWFSLALTALMLLAACGGGDDPTRPNEFAPLTAITLSVPASQSDPSLLAVNTSVQMTAEGIFDDGEFTRTITDECTWTSQNPEVLEPVPGTPSRFRAKQAGPARIVASRASIDGTIVEGVYDLTVTNAAIDSITVTPPDSSVTMGLPQQLTAIGTFVDATRQDITLDAAWTSSDATKATVGETTGVVTGLVAGETTITITALFGDQSGTASVKVDAPVLQSITIDQPTATLIRKATQTFTVTGRYNNNTTAPVSGVTWESSTPAAATIDQASGVATGVAPGTTTIRAKVAGVPDATATLSVVAPTSIEVTGPDTVGLNETVQMTATATFAGNKTLEITAFATWTPTITTNPNSPATVSSTDGDRGKVTGNRIGNNITIQAALDGVEGTKQISVINGGAQ